MTVVGERWALICASSRQSIVQAYKAPFEAKHPAPIGELGGYSSSSLESVPSLLRLALSEKFMIKVSMSYTDPDTGA